MWRVIVDEEIKINYNLSILRSVCRLVARVFARVRLSPRSLQTYGRIGTYSSFDFFVSLSRSHVRSLSLTLSLSFKAMFL